MLAALTVWPAHSLVYLVGVQGSGRTSLAMAEAARHSSVAWLSTSQAVVGVHQQFERVCGPDARLPTVYELESDFIDFRGSELMVLDSLSTRWGEEGQLLVLRGLDSAVRKGVVERVLVIGDRFPDTAPCPDIYLWARVDEGQRSVNCQSHRFMVPPDDQPFRFGPDGRLVLG